MKKVLVFFTASFFFCFFLARISWSQTEPSATPPPEDEYKVAYNQYLLAVQNYSKANQDYVLKKSLYEKFQTQKARQDAFDSTLLMMQAEDDVAISYYTSVLAKFKAESSVPGDVFANLSVPVQSDLDWFVAHKENLSTASTLADLQKDSYDAEAKWAYVHKEVYIILSNIAYYQTSALVPTLDDLFSRAKTKVDEVRNETRDEYKLSDQKIRILDRWLLEADGKITRSKGKLVSLQKQVSDLDKAAIVGQGTYNAIISGLEDAKLSLKEAGDFLSQVMVELKKQD